MKKPTRHELIHQILIPAAVIVIACIALNDLAAPIRWFRFGDSNLPHPWYRWPLTVLIALALPTLCWSYPPAADFLADGIKTIGGGIRTTGSVISTLVEMTMTKRVVACKDGVVAYYTDEKDERKLVALDLNITEILKTNPDADMKALQDALGIIVLSHQKPKPEPETKLKPPDDDVPIGWNE